MSTPMASQPEHLPTLALHQMDCMDYLAQQPDDAFDLAIVDPPYGIGESGAGNRSRCKLAVAKDYPAIAGADKTPPDCRYFEALFRVSKHQIIWGANHFADRFNIQSSAWIVWDKLNGRTHFADCELAWTSFDTAARICRYMWNGMLQGAHIGGEYRRSSVQIGNKAHNERRIHPHQKPVLLYQWLLKHYAKPGQRILDTHLGSGSSAIAAHYYGCDFVGCELDPHYFAATQQRIEHETRQQALF